MAQKFSNAFPSKYQGKCYWCGERFPPGTMISLTKIAVHDNCAQTMEESGPPAKMS